MSKHDYNILLHRLRWQTQMDNFVGLETFEIDCICFQMAKPMTKQQQLDFFEFLGDSDHLNGLPPAAFCDYLDSHGIEWTVSFKYILKLPIRKNFRYWNIVRKLKKVYLR